MTDDEREASLRAARAEQLKGGDYERNIDFLLRRLDQERRRPTLAEIRERYLDAGFGNYIASEEV